MPYRVVKLEAEVQFDTLNVDVVFNVPGQTVEQFASDATVFKKLALTYCHITTKKHSGRQACYPSC